MLIFYFDRYHYLSSGFEGKSNDKYTLYASHSTWETEKHFINWTKSMLFREAHKTAGIHKNIYLDHPEFEGFTVVI